MDKFCAKLVKKRKTMFKKLSKFFEHCFFLKILFNILILFMF